MSKKIYQFVNFFLKETATKNSSWRLYDASSFVGFQVVLAGMTYD